MTSTTLPFGITALRHDFAIPLGPGRSLPRWVLSYVVERDHWVAVDAGVRGAAESLLAATGGQLSLLLLTHSHPDHIGGAPSLVRETHCSVTASEAERTFIEKPEVQLASRPVPGFWELVEGGVGVDFSIQEGSPLLGAGAPPGLEAVATPGHSPGHLAFWDQERRVLFAGDAIPLPGEMPVYDDARATLRSLERLRTFAPFRLLLSAWDEPREGLQAEQAIEHGIEVVKATQRYVDKAAGELGPQAEASALTDSVAQALGLPPHLAGPMLARTVRAHLVAPA